MTAVLTSASSLTCPHGGMVVLTPSQPRAVAGAPIQVQTGQAAVVGCAFTLPGGKPSPCTTVRWVTAATKVTASGTPVLTQVSSGLCLSPEQAPQGPVVVTATQPRVLAL